MAYTLDHDKLLLDLYVAFLCAKKNKNNKPYVQEFQKNLKQNIEELCDSLLNRTYKPLPASCFIIDYPKKREVFAAQFRDKVVHHLYYNYTHELFERTFIEDTYSCIPNRGTHYGINRLYSKIRKASSNYHLECYALKLDIRGYFMHIVREKLCNIALDSINRMSKRYITKDKKETWEDIIDVEFVGWLTKEIVLLDPNKNCIVLGSEKLWEDLDPEKSIRKTKKGLGLPIGNLTSQLFSNVYLNLLDQFIKRDLKCKYYGRYVDDFYILDVDKKKLLSLVPMIQDFLEKNLGLSLNMGKTKINNIRQGVEFLGAYLKPYRIYLSNKSKNRISKNLRNIKTDDHDYVYRAINSYLGVLSHFSSYKLRRELFLKEKFLRIAQFDNGINKMYKPFN